MWRLSPVLVLLLAISHAVWADGVSVPLAIPQNSPGASLSYPPQPAAGYTGPGDVVSGAIAWWGARCYNAAYSGLVADVTDATTGSTTGTRLQCSSGTVSALVSGSACTFVTGNACSSLATTCAVSCNVVTLYDQSGGTNCSAAACNVTQATNANRPLFILNCSGTAPCLSFTGGQILTKAAGLSQAQPYTMSSVWDQSNSVGCGNNNCVILNSDASGNYIEFAPNDFHVALFMIAGAAGALTANSSYTQNVLHASQTVFNGTSSVANLDNTSLTLTGTVGTSPMANGIVIGGDSFSGTLNGEIAEIGVWASAFTTGQQTSMCHNQFTFWGTSTSC